MFQAGSARVDITPPLGRLMAGNAGLRRLGNDVLDPLYARAVVLDDGNERLALVSCDLLGVTYESTRRIRENVAAETEISPDNILVTATHNHQGPQTVRMFREPDEFYVSYFEEQVGSAIQLADKQLEPAALGIAQAEEPSYAHNRRIRMADGRVLLPTQVEDSDAVEGVEGPTDPTLGTVAIENEAGDLLAVLVNYTTHTGVVSGERLTSGFPGRIASVIRDVYDDDTVVLYFPGAAGNIYPYTYDQIDHIHYHDPNGYEKAQRIGETLAGSAMRTFGPIRADMSNDVTLSAATQTLKLDVRNIDGSELEQAQQLLDDDNASKRDRVLARNKLDLEARREHDPIIETEIQLMKIGDVTVATAPGELFVEYGLKIRDAIDGPAFVAGYSNDYLGYLPTHRAIENNGYETTAGFVNRVAPDSGKRVVETVFGLLNDND